MLMPKRTKYRRPHRLSYEDVVQKQVVLLTLVNMDWLLNQETM